MEPPRRAAVVSSPTAESASRPTTPTRPSASPPSSLTLLSRAATPPRRSTSGLASPAGSLTSPAAASPSPALTALQQLTKQFHARMQQIETAQAQQQGTLRGLVQAQEQLMGREEVLAVVDEHLAPLRRECELQEELQEELWNTVGALQQEVQQLGARLGTDSAAESPLEGGSVAEQMQRLRLELLGKVSAVQHDVASQMGAEEVLSLTKRHAETISSRRHESLVALLEAQGQELRQEVRRRCAAPELAVSRGIEDMDRRLAALATQVDASVRAGVVAASHDQRLAAVDAELAAWREKQEADTGGAEMQAKLEGLNSQIAALRGAWDDGASERQAQQDCTAQLQAEVEQVRAELSHATGQMESTSILMASSLESAESRHEALLTSRIAQMDEQVLSASRRMESDGEAERSAKPAEETEELRASILEEARGYTEQQVGQVRAELEALHDHASALSALSEQSFQVAATEALARQQ